MAEWSPMCFSSCWVRCCYSLWVENWLFLRQSSNTAFFTATLTSPTDEFLFFECAVWLFLFQGTSSSISSTVLPSQLNRQTSVFSASPWGLKSCLREFQSARMLRLDQTSALPGPAPNTAERETEAYREEGLRSIECQAFCVKSSMPLVQTPVVSTNSGLLASFIESSEAPRQLTPLPE